jgi:thioredoxin 1
MSIPSTLFKRTALTSTRFRPAIVTPKFYTPTRFAPSILRTFAMADDKKVITLNKKEDWEKAIGEEGLVVLDCFATWCGPCKVISPKVEAFAKQYTDARFYKIDVDELPDLAQELGIRAMPTFLYFKGGDKVDEVVGANPKAIELGIQKHISK